MQVQVARLQYRLALLQILATANCIEHAAAYNAQLATLTGASATARRSSQRQQVPEQDRTRGMSGEVQFQAIALELVAQARQVGGQLIEPVAAARTARRVLAHLGPQPLTERCASASTRRSRASASFIEGSRPPRMASSSSAPKNERNTSSSIALAVSPGPVRHVRNSG